MDQRLKERLIGAVVLVALAVWLIPWLLDGPEREQGADTVALNLPAAEETAPTKSVTIDLDDRGRPEVPADNAATAGEAAADSDAGGEASGDAAAARDADAAARSDARTPSDADARPEQSSSETEASSADAAPARAASAEADADSRDAETSETDTSDADTSDADTPDADTPDADAAAGDAAGPDPRAPSGADSGSASAAEEDWAVQLGSFGEAANAERLAARLEMYGYEPEVSTHRSGGRDLHRVRVGPEPSRARAEAVASALTAHGFVAQVVTAD